MTLNLTIQLQSQPMPTARHHLQTTVFDGKLFALRGRILGDGIPSEDIDEAKSNFNRNKRCIIHKLILGLFVSLC